MHRKKKKKKKNLLSPEFEQLKKIVLQRKYYIIEE